MALGLLPPTIVLIKGLPIKGLLPLDINPDVQKRQTTDINTYINIYIHMYEPF